MSWPTVALEKICRIEIGRTPARNEPTYWGDGVPWLSIADMSQGRHLWMTKEQITTLGVKACNCRIVPPGTLVLSFKLSLGKVGVVQRAMATNEAIAALPVLDPSRVSSEYLYWALKQIDYAAGQDRAAKGLTLNKPKLQALRVPLPPLEEQQRIATILDQAEEVRAKRRAAIALLDQLPQAIFLEMFGVKDRSWPSGTVSDAINPVKGSIRTGPFGSQLLHSEFVESGVAVLGIDNAVANEFRWSQRRFITPRKYQQLKRYTVRPGDVLITIMGTCGRCAIVPADIPLAVNTKHLCCITLDTRRCIPEYLHAYFLYHPDSLSYLGQTTKGAVMGGLNMEIIKKLPLSFPPVELQSEYSARVVAIHQTRSANQTALDHLEILLTSLQTRAFGGGHSKQPFTTSRSDEIVKSEGTSDSSAIDRLLEHSREVNADALMAVTFPPK